MAAKAISCQYSGNNVYVYDERGNRIDMLTFSFPVIAQSFGTGLSIISGTMCYTYMLEDGKLKQTGLHAV